MPFSQIIPPSPSPTESVRLFYTSVSLLESKISVFLRGVEEDRLRTLKCAVASMMLNSGWAAHHLKVNEAGASVSRKESY